MIASIDRYHIQLSLLIPFLGAIIVLGVLGIIALLIIRKTNHRLKGNYVLGKKWKRVFAVFVVLVVIPILILWKLIYRYDDRTAFLVDNKMFNSIFYYQNNRLSIKPFFLLNVFAVMVVLGVLGMITLLIIRKTKPGIKENNVLMKKWKCYFAISVAFVICPILMMW